MRKTIDDYLLALRHEAHRSFPADRAEEIVTEIQTHLEDRVASQVRDGISRPLAEADALKDFGPVRKLVNGFLDAAYETPLARRVRLIAFCLVALMAVILAFCHATTSPDVFATRYPAPLPRWVPIPITVGIVALLLGGLLGRRPQTKQYALIWCAAVCLIGLQVGTNVANLRDAMPGAKAEWGIPATIHRNQISREIQISQKHLRLAEKEANRLQAGMRAFVEGNFKDVPAELKVGDKYLLPMRGTHGLRRSAFAKVVTIPAPHLTYYRVIPQFRFPTGAPGQIQYMSRGVVLATPPYRELVRNHWQVHGTRWLTAKRKAIQRETWLLGAYSTIEQSSGFNTGAIVQRIPLWFLPAIGWLVLLLGTDFIAATTGRFLHRLRREWEWRITAARVR